MSEEMTSLIYDRHGPTVVLTMNRPRRRNALSLDMIVRLADAWEVVDADESIRSVILTGAEGAYCVGGDMDAGWMAGNRAAEPSENERRAMEDMSIIGRGLLLTRWLHTPIIAVVNGDCMGGGCEMLQQTDIRIAEEQARFGVPEVRRGLIAGAGSTMRLKRQIPYAVAMEMLITGRILDAEEALRWGLVTHVVPKGTGLTKGHEIADVIAANGPLSVAASKASAIETGWLPEEEGRVIENRYAAMVTRSDDAKEGMRAFIEKRRPNFTGT
jgi:enoyl-CoA hydratase